MKKQKRKYLGAIEDDGMGFWLGAACFLIPPIGAYQYLAHKDQHPRRARIGGGLALAGVASSILSYQMRKQLATSQKP